MSMRCRVDVDALRCLNVLIDASLYSIFGADAPFELLDRNLYDYAI